MTLEVVLKLQKAVLAERRGEKFRVMETVIKNGELLWEIDQVRWRWMMTEAMSAVQGAENVSVDFIRLPIYIKSPKICLYDRKYRDAAGARKHETFEAFPAGSRITVPFFVLTESDSAEVEGKRPPTREEVISMLEIAGESIGISPWGSKFGYGRFDVVRTDNDVAKS